MTRETISVLITRDELMTLLNLQQRTVELVPPREADQLASFLTRCAETHGYPDHQTAWDDELGEATARRQAAEEAAEAAKVPARVDQSSPDIEQVESHNGTQEPSSLDQLGQLGGAVKLPDGEG